MRNPAQELFFNRCITLLSEGVPAICITIEKTMGSSPRDAGCRMLVSNDAVFDTIGGGQLEWIATSHARAMLSKGEVFKTMTVKLGPEIGQCCGGSVDLAFALLSESFLKEMKSDLPQPMPNSIQIHGAGHTGTALCKALELLPFNASIIDTRRDFIDKLDTGISKIHSPMPEGQVRAAAAGSAFVIFTHEHNLDFLIAAEALQRRDAAYVGMIGSKTKRAVFCKWLEANGYPPHLAEKLTCPIGGHHVKDKRPEIIAALVAAELIRIFARNVPQ